MNILDIHTHIQPHADSKYAVIENCYPHLFNPIKQHYYSVGIHPWLIEDYPFHIDDLYNIANHPQVLAIGEAGLDKFSKTSMEKQENVFVNQIKLSEELNKPLIIHGVRAEQELFRLKKDIKPKQPWILHGYRGGKEQAARYIQHGFYLSLGVHFNKECLTAIPLDSLFLETDEEKIDINELYRELAFLYSISVTNFTLKIKENIALVFG